MSYGQKIREIRRRELMSQEAFADKVGVSRSVISQIEIDRIRPSLEMLRNVSREFDVSLEFLMLYEDEPEKDDTLMANSQNQDPKEDPPATLILKVEQAFNSNLMPKSIDKVSRHFFNYNPPAENAMEEPHEKLGLINEQKVRYTSFHLQQVPLVGIEQHDNYRRMGLRGRWINDLPKLTLPVIKQQQLVAFEMKSDQTGAVLPRNIAVCSLSDLASIETGQEVMIWFHRPVPIFATIEQVAENSFIANSVTYRNREINEIWRIEFLLSNTSGNTSLHQQLARVEAKLDGLMKKG